MTALPQISAGVAVPVMTIRNIPENVQNALKARAKRNGRSAEAEVRAILDDVLFPPDRIKLGTLLRQIGEEFQLTEEEIAGFEDKQMPREPLDFS